jgi:hypothetical protein
MLPAILRSLCRQRNGSVGEIYLTPLQLADFVSSLAGQ